MTTTTAPGSDKPPAAPAPAAAAAPDTVSLTINGTKVTAKKGALLVEAARLAGVEIPVFCYHPKLKPVGACRMCLVEIEKMPRLQTACTTPVGEGMVVKTKSDMAVGGQQAVLSLLLANHPLDCPVCDKGGECPLQDNTFEHGPGVSRFEEHKRHKDKAFELSEHILLDKERCILCYRCVRFHDEIPGDRALAVIDRGGFGEIGVLPGDRYDSPFQGNVVDICPVGALTSRAYRFRSRPWDLQHTSSVAADDPVGSNLIIDSRDGRVLRVRPRDNPDVNDGWLADRTRFGTVPAERSSRLAQPLVRRNGVLEKATWFEALRAASTMVRTSATGVAVHPGVSLEAMGVIRRMALGDVCTAPVASSSRSIKGSVSSIGRSKSVLAIGLDAWGEIPMLALWMRRAVAPGVWGPGGGSLVVIHDKNGLARDTRHWVQAPAAELRARVQDLVDALGGKQNALSAAAASLAGRPTTIVYGAALARDPEAQPLLDKLEELLAADGSGGLVGAPTLFANGRGALEVLGAAATVDGTAAGNVLARAADGSLETLLAVGDIGVERLSSKARGVWLTSSLSASPSAVPAFVDVVLPLAHTYEQAGAFMALDGRVQGFLAGGTPPRDGAHAAKADWEALALLAADLGVALPHDLAGLRTQLSTLSPVFAAIKNPKSARLHVVA